MDEVKMNIAIAAALLFLAGAARAQWWNPTPAPRQPWEKEARVVYDEHLAEVAQLEVQRALDKGDFAKVERMHEEFLGLMKAQGEGRNMPAAIGEGLYRWFSNRPLLQARKLVDDWRAQVPTSALLVAADAELWYTAAWKARGTGYASTVTDEGWKLFRENLDKATRALQDGEVRGKTTPLWYRTALAVAGGTGKPAAVQDAIFDEATRRFPLHRPLYETRLNYLLPQWGGNYDAIDRFIREAVKRTQAVEGTTLYAWLYVPVAGSFRGKDFFGETRASWKLMRHGFEDGLRDPVDIAWLNRYASFACVARDKDDTRRLLATLGRRASLWPAMDGFSPDACEMLAAGS